MLIMVALLSAIVPGAWAQVDPPAQVARLSLVEGSVSFAPADAALNASSGDAWRAAELNRPLTTGDRLWTGPQARAELHVGSTGLRLSEQTSLDILVLNDAATQLRLAQGSLIMRVRVLFQGQRFEVTTPNLAFVLTQSGDYRLDVNPATNITRVVAQQGGGMLYGNGVAPLVLGSSQQASFSGTQLTPAAPGATYQDNFDAWAQDRDRREDQSISARYIPRETIGYQQLDSYGNWSQDATYGAVWMPHAVSENWAPYRVGHWGWVAPWGWTWIDDAPWGFAPFHYGRWAQIGPRWAWVPGQLAPRPIYAPALVAFIGGGNSNMSWNLSLGSGGAPQPSVGWFPLAPGEAFRPTYAASPRYASRINNNIVINNTSNINNITNVYRYQHLPRAVSMASRADFASGQPVRVNAQAMSSTDLARTQVVTDHGALPQRHEQAQRPVQQQQQPVATLPPAALLNANSEPFAANRMRNEQSAPNPLVNPGFKGHTAPVGASVAAMPSVQPPIPLLGRASIAAEEQQNLRNKRRPILPIAEPQVLDQQRLQRNQIELAQRQQALLQNEQRQHDQARQQRDHQERQQQQQQQQQQMQQRAQQAQVKQLQEHTQTQERLAREQGQRQQQEQQKQQAEQRLQTEKTRQPEAARTREPHQKPPIIREQHDQKPS